MRGFNPAHVMFVTLTFDRTHHVSAAPAWRHARACWKRFRDSLVYELGCGVGRSKVKARLVYVQVWEQHESGWPHLHALLISPELARRVRAKGSYEKPHYKTGAPRPIWRFVRQTIRPIAVAAGFGPIADLQFVDSRREAMAGYLVKVARELTEATGKDQRPLYAPIHFRRLSSTPSLLESLKKASEEFTGAIVPHSLDEAPLALELGAVPLTKKLRELMLYGSAGVVPIPPIEDPQWRKPSPVPSARTSTTREESSRIDCPNTASASTELLCAT